jgi:hypothetical protein
VLQLALGLDQERKVPLEHGAAYAEEVHQEGDHSHIHDLEEDVRSPRMVQVVLVRIGLVGTLLLLRRVVHRIVLGVAHRTLVEGQMKVPHPHCSHSVRDSLRKRQVVVWQQRRKEVFGIRIVAEGDQEELRFGIGLSSLVAYGVVELVQVSMSANVDGRAMMVDPYVKVLL